MNPYQQRPGNAFGIRQNNNSGGEFGAGRDSYGNPIGTNYPTTATPLGGAQPSSSPANTVTVTPQNAATYGFDKIGSTINTDTGGIVNPFQGPADGLGGNRDARNQTVQNRALLTPNPVSAGYSQIMSNPQARAFNDRLLNDPVFAMNNRNFGALHPNQTNPYGDGFTASSFTGNTGTAPPPTNPYGPSGTGMGGTTNTTATPSVSGGSAIPTRTSGSGTQTGNAASPNVDPNSGGAPLATTNPAPPEYSMPTQPNSGYTPPAVPAAQYANTGRGGLVNAMLRRYDQRYW